MTYDYDVFLSFRTEDNHGFTTNLYRALKQKGIQTFMDDQKHSSWLAIQKSRVGIIVFSEDYASSRWCLGELLEIMQFRETRAQAVLPIFYNVSQSDVYHQRGSYGEAMERHEQSFGNESDLVLRWRQALTTAAILRYHINKAWFEHDRELIENIIAGVRDELNP